MKKTVAVLGASALLVTLGGVGGAVAGDFVTSHDIKNGTVRSVDVKNGTLGLRDMNNYTVNQIRKSGSDGTNGADGARGPQGPKGDTGATGPQGPKGEAGAPGAPGADGQDAGLSVNETSGPTVVANIGGRFADRATVADTFTLPAGTHQITTDGFFTSTEATSGMTRLQVAVRGGGQDLGTCFTGAASELANREATCSTTRVITVDQPTEVTVYVFGYADNQGSADGGKFSAYTATSALQVAN